MFYEHLGFVENMAVYMIMEDFKETVETYDKIEKGALEMADMMSRGIIKQFPCRFCN